MNCSLMDPQVQISSLDLVYQMRRLSAARCSVCSFVLNVKKPNCLAGLSSEPNREKHTTAPFTSKLFYVKTTFVQNILHFDKRSLSADFDYGPDPSRVAKLVTRFTSYGKRNQESLGELFVTLLIKLASVETLWPKGLCASVFDGAWILKTWESKYGIMSQVEDFTDRLENVARAVGSGEIKRIYQCIHYSLHYISSFMNGKIEATKLREILFGREGVVGLTSSAGKRTLEPGNDFNLMIKKMRSNGSLEEIMMQPVPFAAVLKKIVGINTAPRVVWGRGPTEGWPSGNSPAMDAGKQHSVSANSIWSDTNQPNFCEINAPVIPSFVSQLANGANAT